MITLPLLNKEDLARIDQLLPQIRFIDGKRSASGSAAAVKTNMEADSTDPRYVELVNYLYDKIFRDTYVRAYAQTRSITQPIINKAKDHGGYGTHYDLAFMQFRDRYIRTDLSFTIFLSDPETYEGGELEIDMPNTRTRVKLERGSVCLYPSSRWHQVLPVTKGERICCVGWIESNIPSASMRDALWELTLFSKELTNLGADPEVFLKFNKIQNSIAKSASER